MRFLYRSAILISTIAGAVCCAFGQDEIQLVDIKEADPTIVIDLRYASPNNIAGHPLYSRAARALTRREVAQRLVTAQTFLRRYNFGLKIWDAYRPKSVQVQLWQAAKNNDFVANPDAGAGSLHSWALAVDATLVDNWYRPVTMPTDFDDFTPAAMWVYKGSDPVIRTHLELLQIMMRRAGFYGLRAEWWHFTIENWQNYLPPEEAKRAEEAIESQLQGTL